MARSRAENGANCTCWSILPAALIVAQTLLDQDADMVVLRVVFKNAKLCTSPKTENGGRPKE
jgi:hypothetical protein